MCETTPFVNSVGRQYVASRAQLEQACDSLRQQGSSIKTTIGLSNGDVCTPTTLAEPSTCTIAEALMVPASAMWSTMVVHTSPFHQEILQHACPYHEVVLSCKPHRPACHQWRPLHQQVYDDIQELKPDVLVERYLDAKYYQYSPEDIQEMSDYNSNATNLAESDQIVTLTAMETEDPSMLANIQDNLQELISSVPEWEQETQSINPKWLEHQQSGHLVKDPGCPVCMEEAGSKVNHRRKKADRHPGIMHCDLAAFEASADGHKYCLVAAVTIEVDNVPKLLPFFIPMPKKDAVCAAAALQEALTMCGDRNLYQIKGSRITRIQAGGGGEFTNRKVQDLCWDRHIILSYSPAHQPSSSGIAERMVGMLKTTAQNVETSKSRQRMVVLRVPVCRRIMQDGVVIKGRAPRHLDPCRYHLNPGTDLSELEKSMPWQSICDEFRKFKWIDHAGRIYQGIPFSVEPDITSKHVFIASMMHL